MQCGALVTAWLYLSVCLSVCRGVKLDSLMIVCW